MLNKYAYEAIANDRKHQWVHQYTTFSALERIISNRTLRLSRIDQPNDRVENDHLVDVWKKVYAYRYLKMME